MIDKEQLTEKEKETIKEVLRVWVNKYNDTGELDKLWDNLTHYVMIEIAQIKQETRNQALKEGEEDGSRNMAKTIISIVSSYGRECNMRAGIASKNIIETIRSLPELSQLTNTTNKEVE